jgi:hypothetical protein
MSIEIVGYVFAVTAIVCFLAYWSWSKRTNR